MTRTPGPAALALAVEISATGSLPLPAPPAGSTPPWGPPPWPGPSYPRPSVNARTTGQCDAGHWHRTLPQCAGALERTLQAHIASLIKVLCSRHHPTLIYLRDTRNGCMS